MPEPEGVARLVSDDAIRRVLYSYCRGVDRGDKKLIASLYHPGAIDNHGPFTGTGAEFAEYVVGAMDGRGELSQHHITNVLIEYETDAKALVESYFVSLRSSPGAATRLSVVGGRYLDTFTCEAGRWAIRRRHVVFDCALANIDGRQHGLNRHFPAGARGQQDPLYTRER